MGEAAAANAKTVRLLDTVSSEYRKITFYSGFFFLTSRVVVFSLSFWFVFFLFPNVLTS